MSTRCLRTEPTRTVGRNPCQLYTVMPSPSGPLQFATNAASILYMFPNVKPQTVRPPTSTSMPTVGPTPPTNASVRFLSRRQAMRCNAHIEKLTRDYRRRRPSCRGTANVCETRNPALTHTRVDGSVRALRSECVCVFAMVRGFSCFAESYPHRRRSLATHTHSYTDTHTHANTHVRTR